MQPDARRRAERRGPDRPFHTGRRAADRIPAIDPEVDAATAAVPAVPATPAVPAVPVVPVVPVGNVARLPLEVELANAGLRARSDRIVIERPDPVFIDHLRTRLVDRLPVTQLMPVVAVEQDGRRGGSAGAPMIQHGYLPRLALHAPNIRHAPSWAAAIGIGLIIGIVGLAAGRSVFTPTLPPSSRAVEAAGATLIRNGQGIDLGSGTAIQTGDEIRTAADGHAIVALGSSRARLAGNADLVVTAITADNIALEQVAGRVYHRVWVPAGGTYVVTTAGMTWTARGTAFDLERQPEPGGGTRLSLLTIENSVHVTATDISVTVPQGRQAEIVIGAGTDAPNLSIGPQIASALDDPWLVDNASRDVGEGFDPGGLANRAGFPVNTTASAAPTVEASASAAPPSIGAPSPTPSPIPSPSRSIEPTTEPTTEPTPTPSVTPTASPTPTTAPIQALTLSVKACPGGTILDWSAAAVGSFDHYRTYRSSSASFGSPILISGTTTASRTATSAADTNASGSRWYRTYAYDADGNVIGKSDTRSATGLGAPDPLDPFAVGAIAGQTAFTWTAPALATSCGTVTKLVYSTADNPTYGAAGARSLDYSGDVGSHEVMLGSAPKGTWWFRVQVLRVTDLGTVVTAQSTPVRYRVP